MCNDVLRNVSSELQKEASSHLDFSVYTFFLSSHSVTLYKTQDEYAAEFPPNACIETKLRRFHISRLTLAFYPMVV